MARTHVIIVNYNAGAWLLKAVESALRYSEGPITVVDNASTDDSVQRSQDELSDARVNWVLNEDNRGFAAANNQVLSRLDEEFAILMNPDCVLHEGAIETLLQAFEQYPTMGMAGGLILNQDGTVQKTCRRRFPTPWSALVRMLQLHRLFPHNPRFANFDYGDLIEHDNAVEFVDAISGAFMMLRKTALEQIGLLDEDYFMHCEDLDWCKRFSNAGLLVGFVPAAVITHAKGVSTRSRPIGVLWTLHTGMLRFFDKFYREQYSWPLRATVKVGIAVSFLGRALMAVFR